MPLWTQQYLQSLRDKLAQIVDGLDTRLEAVANGRTAPALDSITIGSGRKMRTAILFFDIRGFTNRTTSADVNSLKNTLFMLDCVIPMVMQVIYDFGGYIEKNTGDGLMAIIGAEKTDAVAANDALNTATTIFYVLKNVINPLLEAKGIQKVDARIGIDLGTVLIARIGLPTGTARHPRNFLTAVGPSANLACKIQGMADTNQIWVGDNIKSYAADWRQDFFIDKTPVDWVWNYSSDANRSYKVWLYNASKSNPSI
jgi:class 3 adenylate cyclase